MQALITEEVLLTYQQSTQISFVGNQFQLWYSVQIWTQLMPTIFMALIEEVGYTFLNFYYYHYYQPYVDSPLSWSLCRCVCKQQAPASS